jgi:hypothetical protein
MITRDVDYKFSELTTAANTRLSIPVKQSAEER